MFKNLGVQLYTVRDTMTDEAGVASTFEKLAKHGYTELHTAGCKIDEKRFVELANENGLKIIGTHIGSDLLFDRPEEAMELHRLWGTTNIGTGGMSPEYRYSKEGTLAYIEKFNAAAKIYAANGFRMTYHHHNFEFVRVDGKKTIMDMLYEGLDPENTSFVLDTCWVAAGGGDVTEWMEKLAGRIDILHLKDTYLEKDEEKGLIHVITEVGNGSVCWDKVMATAEKIGVSHYVVEHDKNWETGCPFESLKTSADFLAKYRK